MSSHSSDSTREHLPRFALRTRRGEAFVAVVELVLEPDGVVLGTLKPEARAYCEALNAYLIDGYKVARKSIGCYLHEASRLLKKGYEKEAFEALGASIEQERISYGGGRELDGWIASAGRFPGVEAVGLNPTEARQNFLNQLKQKGYLS